MKSNLKLGLFGLVAITTLCVGACVGAPDPEADGPVGEAQQASATCTSDCSGIPGASPITYTCANSSSCSVNSTEIICGDGTIKSCTDQCVADYGQTCTYQRCPACGGHSYYLYGTYDCTGVCESGDFCCCLDGKPC